MNEGDIEVGSTENLRGEERLSSMGEEVLILASWGFQKVWGTFRSLCVLTQSDPEAIKSLLWNLVLF